MIRKSPFKPAWWLPGPHLQTLWPTFLRRRTKVPTRRERFRLPDGDFLDLDWAISEVDKGPLVLILHGLGGSIESPYTSGMLKAIVDYGWRGVLMHFRGCSGEPNRLPRTYHLGETADVSVVVAELQARYPNTPIIAIGFSLGGNVLLKWLGETGKSNPLAAAVAVSVPFEIAKAASHVSHGFSRIYHWYFLRYLVTALKEKHKHFRLPLNLKEISKIRSIWEFDDKVTAPLHGFSDVHDYYAKSSCRQYLKNIQIPTLVLHASDDPLMTKDVIAGNREISSSLTLELSDCGGHVGFVSGNNPLKPKYWLEKRIPEFLEKVLAK